MTKLTVSNQAIIIAARAMIAIRADDGSRIVITPALARDLAAQLPQFADLAEGLSAQEPKTALPSLFYNHQKYVQ